MGMTNGLLAVGILAAGGATATVQWQPVDIAVTAAADVADPAALLLTATFRGPQDRRLDAAGTWSGGRTWTLRFAPPLPGTWAYETRGVALAGRDGPPLFASGPVRGGEAARPVTVEVTGALLLELLVADGGDGAAWDHADWGEARLVRADGGVVFLGDLTPLVAEQGYGTLAVDRNLLGQPLRVGERTFERGLGTHATSRLVYRLDAEFARFEAWVGVDAACREHGSVTFAVRTAFRAPGTPVPAGLDGCRGVLAVEPAVPPLVGAIRWDAWYGEGPVAAEVERALGPRKYHFRLPFFATVVSDAQVSINGDTADTMDRELAYAATAGLGYWAFVDYWEDPFLSLALHRYRTAVGKRGLRYCFIEEGGRLDGHGVAGWPRLVEYFRDPHYQTVLEGRPLLFVFAAPKKLGRPEFEQLAAATTAAGLARPYIVLMGWNPADDWKQAQALGFDAVSAYAAGGQYAGDMLPYPALTELVRNRYWEVCRRERIPTVTFATAGWDTRPRIERPPPWCPWVQAKPDPTPPAEQTPLVDAVTASPEQIARHIADAVAWTQANRELNPANAVIIYAWNENDEGGWLVPTRAADGTPLRDRIETLGRVLRPPAGEDGR